MEGSERIVSFHSHQTEFHFVPNQSIGKVELQSKFGLNYKDSE